MKSNHITFPVQDDQANAADLSEGIYAGQAQGMETPSAAMGACVLKSGKFVEARRHGFRRGFFAIPGAHIMEAINIAETEAATKALDDLAAAAERARDALQLLGISIAMAVIEDDDDDVDVGCLQ